MTQTLRSIHTDDEMLIAGVSVIPVEQAKKLVAFFADVTTRRDIDTFAAGFTADCSVRFNGTELHGLQALRDFMGPRLAFYPASYRCTKTLRAISGNVLGVEFDNTWTDAKGKSCRGRGTEFWVMQGEQIARWDATYVNFAALV
jgi:nuclear transport factor 2 (NTF2) superfamily protein